MSKYQNKKTSKQVKVLEVIPAPKTMSGKVVKYQPIGTTEVKETGLNSFKKNHFFVSGNRI